MSCSLWNDVSNCELPSNYHFFPFDPFLRKICFVSNNIFISSLGKWTSSLWKRLVCASLRPLIALSLLSIHPPSPNFTTEILIGNIAIGSRYQVIQLIYSEWELTKFAGIGKGCQKPTYAAYFAYPDYTVAYMYASIIALWVKNIAHNGHQELYAVRTGWAGMKSEHVS